MENPFKKILKSEKISMDVKSKVLGDVERLKLVIELADLFMIKHPSTLNDILKTAKNKNK